MPKRHARRSVTRNLLRRQIRAVMADQLAALPPGLWLVRLRTPFAKDQFVSAASDALRDGGAGELQQLFGAPCARAARRRPDAMDTLLQLPRGLLGWCAATGCCSALARQCLPLLPQLFAICAGRAEPPWRAGRHGAGRRGACCAATRGRGRLSTRCPKTGRSRACSRGCR
jgi:ribonuclease P protein component